MSYIAQVRREQSQVRFLVMDGSRSAATRNEVTRVATSTSNVTGAVISVVGDTDVSRSLAYLAKDLPLSIVEWLLLTGAAGYSAGAVRNRALLQCAGERVLMVDDDTIGRPWRDSDTSAAIDFIGHEDMSDFAFFEDRVQATDGTGTCEVDLLGVHQLLLGKTFAELTGRYEYRAGSACNHILQDLRRRHTSRSQIRITWAGVAGDAAVYCPYWILFATGRLRQLLAEDQSLFDRALHSREIRRSVRRATVHHDPSLMTYCAALDNASLLPPFSPHAGNEDGLFARTLLTWQSSAYIAKVPVGIVHDSSRPASYSPTDIPSTCGLRIADVLAAATEAWAAIAPDTDQEGRLRSLGKHFIGWSSRPRQEFRDDLILLAMAQKAELLRRCACLLGDGFPYPRYWRDCLQRYGEAALASLSEPQWYLPLECRYGDAPDGLESIRKYVGMWGEALTFWPSLWARGREASGRLFL